MLISVGERFHRFGNTSIFFLHIHLHIYILYIYFSSASTDIDVIRVASNVARTALLRPINTDTYIHIYKRKKTIEIEEKVSIFQRRKKDQSKESLPKIIEKGRLRLVAFLKDFTATVVLIVMYC